MRTVHKWLRLKTNKGAGGSWFPSGDMIFWVLRTPFVQAVAEGSWKTVNIFGNTDYDAITAAKVAAPAGEIKLTPPDYLIFGTGDAKLIAVDAEHDNTFFYTDATGTVARKVYVGNLTGEPYFDYEDKHFIFAKPDADGINHFLVFETARSESTIPALSTVISYLTGTLEIDGVVKTDSTGRPILDEYGRIQRY
jgi:hypothetical protein